MEGTISILTSAEALISLLISVLSQYGLIGYAISVFLFGEIAIVLGLLLLQTGGEPMFDVLGVAAIGTILADLFWFFVGRHFPRNVVPYRIRSKIFAPTYNILASLIQNHVFISLFFLKFFVGVRLVSVLYISMRPITLVRFIVYDLFGTIFYLLCLAGLLSYVGNTLEAALPAYHLLSNLMLGMLLLFIAAGVTRLVLFSRNRVNST